MPSDPRCAFFLRQGGAPKEAVAPKKASKKSLLSVPLLVEVPLSHSQKAEQGVFKSKNTHAHVS